MLSLRPYHNARYAKLRIIRRKAERHISDRRFRKVISLTATACVSSQIVSYVTRPKQGIEVASVKYAILRRNQSAVVAKDHVFKIGRHKCGVPDVVSCFAILCHYDLPSEKTELRDFILFSRCDHEAVMHSRSYRPIIIDIGIVAQTNWQLTRGSLFVDATDAYIRDLPQSDLFQATYLQ